MMFNGYIKQFIDVAHNIRVVTIKIDAQGAPFSHRAGQYISLDIDGYDPRYFSIASAPRADNTIDIHVRDSGQNISHHLCHHIKQGDAVKISPAQGILSLDDTIDQPIVMIAGGTGITPFLAMLDAETTKPVTLYWGMQSEHDFYIRPRRPHLSVYYCVDQYPIDAYLESTIDNAKIYLSGPPAMVKDSLHKLLVFGVEEDNIHYDGS